MNAERSHFPSPCSSRTTAEPDANSNASPHNSHGHRASQDEHHLHVLLPGLFDVRSVVAVDVHTLAVSTPPEAQSGDPDVRCAATNSRTAGELLLEQLCVHPSDSAPRREEQRTREGEGVMTHRLFIHLISRKETQHIMCVDLKIRQPSLASTPGKKKNTFSASTPAKKSYLRKSAMRKRGSPSFRP